jgi:GxxExxY protein
MDQLIHQELSEDVIGAAMKVLNALKLGLDEKLYENALLIELTKRGHRIDQQKSFPAFYEGNLVGTLIPDLIVDNLVVVDPKVVSGFTRHASRANDRLPRNHGPAACAATELQVCPPRVEARRANSICRIICLQAGP